jgi:DNA polymerase-4
VITSHKRKSWSSENTFPTDITRDEVADYLKREAQKLWEAMTKHNMHGRTITVKLRTPDFHTATRRLTPEALPQSAEELAQIALTLLDRFEFAPASRFRLAGIGLSNFEDEEDEKDPKLFA